MELYCEYLNNEKQIPPACRLRQDIARYVLGPTNDLRINKTFLRIATLREV